MAKLIGKNGLNSLNNSNFSKSMKIDVSLMAGLSINYFDTERSSTPRSQAGKHTLG